MNAIRQLEPDIRIGLVEVDLKDKRTPDTMKHWGSPTILIDGEELTGAPQGSGDHCRIYKGHGGVPSVTEIAAAIGMVLGRTVAVER